MDMGSARDLPRVWRLTFSAFLVTTWIGVMLGSGFVEHTTRLLPEGIAERYLGTEAMGVDIESMPAEREFQSEKSVAELYALTHTHIIGLAVVFLAIAVIFLWTGVLPRWRTVLAVEPFVSLVVTFGGMWAVRFVHPGFAWLIALSGTAMVLAITVMTFASIRGLFK